MKTDKTEIGNYLRALRHGKGVTLHQVSMKVDIDSPLISKIETGERLPTLQQVKKFAVYYGVDEEALTAMTTAGKILKEYGISEATLQAINLVKEQLTPYLKRDEL